MTGLNDARLHGRSSRSLDSYTAVLQMIFRALAAAEPGALIASLEQPHLVDYTQHAPHDQGSDALIDAYNERMRAVANDHPRVLVAVATDWDPSTMLAADTVHPNDAGHLELAWAAVDTNLGTGVGEFDEDLARGNQLCRATATPFPKATGLPRGQRAQRKGQGPAADPMGVVAYRWRTDQQSQPLITNCARCQHPCMSDGFDWTASLVGQLEFYWNVHLWPRLQGLSDGEYFWQPVPNSWTLHQGPDGRWFADTATTDQQPTPPVTTIAWRMAHIAVGCFATRASTFFGDGSVGSDADMFDPRHAPLSLPGTAADAMEFLERSYRRWHDGIASLSYDDLLKPLGSKGGWFAADPMAELILHINREVMHHGGELGLLRDLYSRHVGSRPIGA